MGNYEYVMMCPGMADKVALMCIIGGGDSAAYTALFTSDGASISINKDIRQRLETLICGCQIPNQQTIARQHCLLNCQPLGMMVP